MKQLPANAQITTKIWNDVVNDTSIPYYDYSWRNSHVKGGILDPYRIAGNSFILGAIDDNITLYSAYRDTRSNYLLKNQTFGTAATTPAVATNYTARLNDYSATGGDRPGRLLNSASAGSITTLNTSIYLIYANIVTYPPNPSYDGDFYIAILKNGTPVAEASTSSLVNSSVFLQAQYLSLYESATYTLQWSKSLSTAQTTGAIVLGYSEFIGNKNGCGAIP